VMMGGGDMVDAFTNWNLLE